MRRDKDPNRELMLKRGSKTGAYDADAPDQWKFDLRHGEGEVKALAWIKSTTIALNHKSPFCVDEHGNWLYLDRMAVDCGWALQTARNVAAGLEKNGRIRLEKGKRIWYAADVPLAHTDLPEESDETDEADDDQQPVEGGQTGPKSATKGGANNSVHGCSTTYVVDFIKKLPAERRAVAEAKIGALASWKSEFIADGMAALRSITERVEDITYSEIGIPKKRLPKRREPECKWVQLSLLAEPNFVHGCSPDQNGNSVHGMESTSYKVQNGLYKSQGGGASLLCSTTAPTPTTTGAPPPSDDALVVVAKLHDYGATISQPAARRMINQCRMQAPNCTLEDVLSAVDYIGRTMKKGNIDNRTGLFVSQVPPLLATQQAMAARTQEADKQAREHTAAKEITALREIAADESEPEGVRKHARARLAELGKSTKGAAS